MSLRGKGSALAVRKYLGFFRDIRAADGAKNAQREQLQELSFSGRNRRKRGIRTGERGDQREVIGHLTAVADLRDVYLRRNIHSTDFRGDCHILRDTRLHIVGEIATVRARIGAELLLIQALRIVQRLLGGIAEHPVGFTLQRSQIIELRRRLKFLLARDLSDGTGFSFAQVRELGRFLFTFQPFTEYGRIEVKLHREERFRYKRTDLCLTLHDEGQRRGHDAPDLERVMVNE